MIDTHAHLSDEKLKNNIERIIKAAKLANITAIISVGYDLQSSKENCWLATDYKEIYATIGVHPEDAQSYTEKVEKEFKNLALNQKVVAIGEIGLDYHYSSLNKEKQKEVFIQQIKLAHSLKLPIIIHTRDAMEDTLQILEIHKELIGCGGIVHCFEGSASDAEKIIKLGLLIGIAGNVTYKNSKVAESIINLPLDKIVVETDCPYLAPVPFRGKINEPENVKYTLEKVAQILCVDIKELDKITTLNAKKVYNI